MVVSTHLLSNFDHFYKYNIIFQWLAPNINILESPSIKEFAVAPNSQSKEFRAIFFLAPNTGAGILFPCLLGAGENGFEGGEIPLPAQTSPKSLLLLYVICQDDVKSGWGGGLLLAERENLSGWCKEWMSCRVVVSFWLSERKRLERSERRRERHDESMTWKGGSGERLTKA